MAQVIRRENGGGHDPSLTDVRHLIHAPRKIASILPRESHPSPANSHAPKSNRLLDALPQDEYARLRPHLENATLSQGTTLYQPEERITHVYFPISALISLVGTTEDGQTVETGMAGAEGMAGLPVLWSARRTPHMAVVRHVGDALRMNADVFRREVNHTPKLRELLMRYTDFSFNSAAQTALCSRFHTVEQHVAAWLLTTRDRLAQNEFHLTRDLIAHSLGVRRSGVSVEVKKFERAGLLRLSRAHIKIVDGRGLEETACECYGVIKTEFERYLGDCARSASSRVLFARQVAV